MSWAVRCNCQYRSFSYCFLFIEHKNYDVDNFLVNGNQDKLLQAYVSAFVFPVVQRLCLPILWCLILCMYLWHVYNRLTWTRFAVEWYEHLPGSYCDSLCSYLLYVINLHFIHAVKWFIFNSESVPLTLSWSNVWVSQTWWLINLFPNY